MTNVQLIQSFIQKISSKFPLFWQKKTAYSSSVSRAGCSSSSFSKHLLRSSWAMAAWRSTACISSRVSPRIVFVLQRRFSQSCIWVQRNSSRSLTLPSLSRSMLTVMEQLRTDPGTDFLPDFSSSRKVRTFAALRAWLFIRSCHFYSRDVC